MLYVHVSPQVLVACIATGRTRPALVKTREHHTGAQNVAIHDSVFFRFDLLSFLGSVLEDVILTDGRLLDAFGTVNKRRKSVQKAKAPSVPVDLRGRSPSALSVDDFSTLALRPFFRPFQAFRCPLDASSWIIPEGPS